MIGNRISNIYGKSEVIDFDDSEKIVLMSDMHRSDGSSADRFLQNQSITLAALHYYCNNDYLYIELGDGDELWADKTMDVIKFVNFPIFSAMRRFHTRGRLKMLYGNHDMQKKDARWVSANLTELSGEYSGSLKLFEKIKISEGLVLRYRPDMKDILLIHGHQADFLNYNLWRLAKFLVRYVWKPMELIGVKDPTSASTSLNKRGKIDSQLANWTKAHGRALVAGHTHRTVFPKTGEPPYFNDGCCVHPYRVSALEIADGAISLVQWKIEAGEQGMLFVARSVIKGPVKLTEFFS